MWEVGDNAQKKKKKFSFSLSLLHLKFISFFFCSESQVYNLLSSKHLSLSKIIMICLHVIFFFSSLENVILESHGLLIFLYHCFSS